MRIAANLSTFQTRSRSKQQMKKLQPPAKHVEKGLEKKKRSFANTVEKAIVKTAVV